MPLWNANNPNPQLPQYFTNNAISTAWSGVVGFPGLEFAGQGALANTYADVHGWILSWPPKGAQTKTECLVAIPNLQNTIGNSVTTMAFFTPSTFGANAKANLVICWNKQISVNIAAANINVSMNGSVALTNVLANFVSGNTTNQLRFQFTSLIDLQGNTGYFGNGTVLITYALPSYAKVNAASGSFLDINCNTGFGTTGLTANNLAWNTPTTSIQPQALWIHQIPSVINLAFQYPAINVGANTNNLYVNFSNNVWVYLANSVLTLSSANGPTQNMKAYYMSGNGTTQLQFEVLCPPNSTWLSVNASSTGASWTGGPIISGANGNVFMNISSSLANTAGNVNVYSALVITQFIFANQAMATGQTSNVFMILNGPVQVLGGGGVNTANLLVGSTNGSYNIVATFTGQGNGTSNLAFQFAAPANTTNLNVTTGAASVGLNTGTIFLSNFPGYFTNVGSYTITAAMSTQVANVHTGP